MQVSGRTFRLFTIGLTSLLLAACADVGVFMANLPSQFGHGKLSENVSYGTEKNQALDIYQPKGKADKPRDVVVFFYGGSWQTGSKSDYRFVARAFVEKGYVVVIPDYRKYPDIKFPVFVQDGAKALAWVSDNIQTYGGDQNRIHLMGHSAGAHIAALLATDASYLAAENKKLRETIHDFTGLAGPYEFTPEEEDLKAIFGPPANYPNMQPAKFVDGNQPPMLLLYGGKDDIVGRFNLDRMVANIEKQGGCVESKIYPSLDHVWIVGALSWLGEGKAPVLADIDTFLKNGPAENSCHKAVKSETERAA